MAADKILDRIQKLLRLAESSNVNEAAAAAAQAQRLMEKHSIDQAMLSVESDEADLGLGELTEVESRGKIVHWRTSLLDSLASVNRCRVYLSRNRAARKVSLQLVGHANDVAAVRYLFEYLASTIQRLARTSVNRGDHDYHFVSARMWGQSFRVGAVQEIRRRLKEAHQAERTGREQEAHRDGAIVLVKDALARLDEAGAAVDAFLAGMNLRRAPRSQASLAAAGFDAGQEAARSIELGGGRGGLGAGASGELEG